MFANGLRRSNGNLILQRRYTSEDSVSPIGVQSNNAHFDGPVRRIGALANVGQNYGQANREMTDGR